jgi:hypothetical protein
VILGMTTFTIIHVLISLVAIASGPIVLYGLLTSDRLDGWTAIFLTMTVATSVTGFLFPFHGVTPAVIVGILSLVLLAIAIAARYYSRLVGPWRWIYVVTAVMSLYLNVFVLVVQSFQKIPALHALAPKGSEPPFAIAQAAVLIAFLVLGYISVRRFKPALG